VPVRIETHADETREGAPEAALVGIAALLGDPFDVARLLFQQDAGRFQRTRIIKAFGDSPSSVFSRRCSVRSLVASRLASALVV